MTDDDSVDVNVELLPGEYEIHAGETVSTGEYESATVDASIEGDIVMDQPDFDALREQVRAQANKLQQDVKELAEDRRSGEEDGDSHSAEPEVLE